MLNALKLPLSPVQPEGGLAASVSYFGVAVATGSDFPEQQQDFPTPSFFRMISKGQNRVKED